MAFELIPRDTTQPLLVLLRILGQLLVVMFLLVLVYGGVQLAFLAGAQPSTALRLPMSVPYMITPVAATLMAVASALRLVDLCRRLLPGARRGKGA
jgi:TRAP-type C4-dicarboxylate transport system permease small subunit